jgi:dihydroorotate dehydrogenase
MMTVLSTTLAGIPFPSCVMNASGAWSGTHEELRELAASATGAVVIKTATTQARVEKVQRFGSALMREGPGVFARIQQELSAMRTMRETGA